ncbi:MAG: DUF2474 domain-containing protein [Pseudomonadota bacterium]
MRAIIEPVEPPDPGAPRPPLRTRLAWFVGLAIASAVAVAAVAYGLKTLLG